MYDYNLFFLVEKIIINWVLLSCILLYLKDLEDNNKIRKVMWWLNDV